VKPDERAFLAALQAEPTLPPRAVIAALGMNPKRAHYLLDKWAERGWYDYGVCIDLGWLTIEGKNEPASSHAERVA